MRRAILLCAFLGIVAESSPRFYGDAAFSFGAAHGTLIGNDYGFLHYGTNFTFALFLNDEFFVGLSADLGYLGQVTALQSGGGNLRGIRGSVGTPTLGFEWENWLIKVEIPLVGFYQLLNASPGQSTVSYLDQSGIRVHVGYRISTSWRVGVQIYSNRYSTISDSSLGSMRLNRPYELFELSLLLGYRF